MSHTQQTNPTPPAYIKEAKNLLTQNTFGLLSTLSHANSGYPYGSIVPYDIDSQGRIVILVAQISEHYRNLEASSKANLLVFDPFGIEDPQAHSRLSIFIDFIPVLEDEREAVSGSYWTRFPGAPEREIAHAFTYFRAIPNRARWIGGFGDIHWIKGTMLNDITRDPIAYIGSSVIAHMNRDHPDALHDYARYHGQKTPTDHHVRMVAVTSENFTLSLTDRSGKEERLVISLPTRVANAEEVRTTFIEMLRECREKGIGS